MTATGKTLTQNVGAPTGIRPRVLIANAPGAYRDAISRALRVIRPEVEVFDVTPAELDGEYARLQPDLTVCSRLTRVVESGMSDWIELYPEGTSFANLSVEGERSSHARPDFDLILSLVDRLLPET